MVLKLGNIGGNMVLKLGNESVYLAYSRCEQRHDRLLSALVQFWTFPGRSYSFSGRIRNTKIR